MLDKSARVDAEDLAFGIQFNMQFPENRSLGFSTACIQDIAPAELKSLLRKMSDAADYLDAVYRLRAMRKYLEQQENELRTSREQQNNSIMLAKTEWTKGKRFGEFEMTAAQAAAHRNFSTTQDRIQLEIGKIREQIAELEATVRTDDAASGPATPSTG